MTISGNVETETDSVAVKCFEMVKNMYSKEYSEIWNLFYAVHVSEMCDLNTGKRINITPEPYFMIDLPIPQNNKSPSLIDCFDHYRLGTKKKEAMFLDISLRVSFWAGFVASSSSLIL